MAGMGQEITDDDLATMRAQLEGESAQKLSDLKGPKFGLLPVVWVAIILSSLQQLVGINVIFYYSSMLWQAVGFAEDDSLKISVISAASTSSPPSSPSPASTGSDVDRCCCSVPRACRSRS